MASHASSSRPRSIDLPQPETGLAEWMSKIKAMQRQVDADDEAEQRKLEEEIAASRLARLRRSHVVGSRSPTSSLDLSQKPEYAGVLKNDAAGDRSTDNLPTADRREDALRKLMGNRGVPSPTRTTTQEQLPVSAQSRSRPETTSLAAFMGGRATGPRLNKHAPQQDAHDPTQFDQRTRVDAPHPVFGRGGVAMPGMAAKEKTPSPPAVSSQTRGREMLDRSYSAGSVHHNQTGVPGALPATKLYVAGVEDRPTTVPKFGDGYGVRERGAIISNSNSRTKSPHRTSAYNNNKSGNGGSELLEAFTDKRDITRNSPTSGSSSRTKTPEPSPSTQVPRSRPVSRGYESSSTYHGLGSTSTRPVAQPEFAPLSSKKPEPVSLAAFMGGRATGPRLNRHAPQQNAHDPTQFEQRTSITAPHPVFGKGGVAMPGMAAKETSSGMFKASTQLRGMVDAPQSTSEEQSLTPFRTGNRVGSRERTVSTPGGATRKYSEGDYMKSNNIRRPVSQSSIRDTQPNTTNSPSSSPPTVSHLYTPRRRGISTSTAPVSLPKSSPVTMPSLARPIQPAPRQSSTGPQVPPSNNPSRAFLRPPAEKELTPSLNKLKGRGFVQSMIQTSSQLEANANEFGATSATTDKGQITRPRKSSVLERWQPTASTSANSVSPPISPKPIPVRKSHTIDPCATSPGAIQSTSSPGEILNRNKPLKMVASVSSVSPTQTPRPASRTSKKNDIPISMPPQDTPGLGSSSTLISYIKPTKTGDDPTPPPASIPLEVRTGVSGARQGTKSSSTSDLSASPGVPLKHPTKSRARKPTKDRDHKQIQSNTPGSTASVTQSQVDRKRSAPSVTAGLDFPTPPISIPQASLANNRSMNVNMEQSINDSQSSASRISDRWADQAIIGVKSVSAKPVEGRSEPATLGSGSLLARRALPGLTASIPMPSPGSSGQEDKPYRSPITPLSPDRRPRIPSTGNRPTVMDVAQVWNEQQTQESATPEGPPSKQSSRMIEELVEAVPQPRLVPSPIISTEKRRSSCDRYSATILPLSREEKAPAPSPNVTFSRSSAQTQVPPIDTKVVRFEHVDDSIPEVNIHPLVITKVTDFIPDPDQSTISIEVMAIVKSTANPISNDIYVFYDTETLAIIHRSKSKSSGLVFTKLWSWQGKRSQPGAKEATKLQELSKRYRTSFVTIRQYEEPSDFVYLLGGELVVRQGIRTHWTSENTAMHSVRSYNGFIFIEEHDLNIANLCSGFSFCLTILDILYVWYGCGSRQPERTAALKYAQRLAAKGSTVVEMVEGETDNDEMFWTMLGSDDYAKADYWKWRRTTNFDPRAWQIDTPKGKNAVQLVSSFSKESTIQDSVYLIDCIWEYFVLVEENARGKRRDIRLAISIAQKLSSHVAKTRPFSPPIHVLILPSKLPLDLRLHFRDLDERYNQQNIPDHMNILSSAEAIEHLQRTSWERVALRDHTILPLGLHPSAIP